MVFLFTFRNDNKYPVQNTIKRVKSYQLGRLGVGSWWWIFSNLLFTHTFTQLLFV